MERKYVKLLRKPCYKVTKQLETSFLRLLLICIQRVSDVISRQLMYTYDTIVNSTKFTSRMKIFIPHNLDFEYNEVKLTLMFDWLSQ